MSENEKTKNRPSKEKPSNAAAGPAGTRTHGVFCRRIQLVIPVVEHASCPYCFGKETDIRSGDHEKFCDFQEGKDPICFGFPWT
jgi:hypothetical protein